MGILDFLKKKDDPLIGADSLGLDTTPLGGIEQHEPSDFGMHESSSNMQPNYGNPSNTVNLSSMGFNSMNNQSNAFNPSSNLEKDIQIITLKLDAVKVIRREGEEPAEEEES